MLKSTRTESVWGYYRIGHLVGPKDKWWNLKQDDDRVPTQAWCPSGCGNGAAVLSDSVEDVLSILQELGVTIARVHKAGPQ
jgi:hypothetical protein